jgi:hypothetical protein
LKRLALILLSAGVPATSGGLIYGLSETETRRKHIVKYPKYLAVAAAICALTSPQKSLAVGFYCPPGKVNFLSLGDGGTVFVSTTTSVITAICSVSADFSNVKADTCRAWYASLLSQKSLGRSVTIFFDTANPYNTTMNTTNCTANAPWITHPPYNIQLEDY